MRNATLIAIAALLTAGCAGTSAAIKNDTVSVGMTKSEVRSAWGQPTMKNDASFGSEWRWAYKRIATPAPDQYIVRFDESGHVTEWLKPQ